MRVAGTLGDLEALAEVAVGPVVLPQVGVGDAEVHVRRRAAMLVVRGAVGFHRALVMRDRLDYLAPDVRNDAEVLLDAREQLARLTAELERLNEMQLRLFQSARTQREPTQGVQRLGGERSEERRVGKECRSRW